MPDSDVERFEQVRPEVIATDGVLANLSAREIGNVLRAVAMAGTLDFLKRHPLRAIVFWPGLRDHESVRITGRYVFRSTDQDYRTLYLDSARQPVTYGASFIPGKTYSVSLAGKNRVDAMRRTLVHELGHHVLEVCPELRRLLLKAYKVQRRTPVTIYGERLPDEYFAECFAAYVFHRKALERHDPVGYKMVVEVRKVAGLKP